MSISTLVFEMIVIFALIAVGYALKKMGHMPDSTVQSVSYIVSFITCPALNIEVALSYEGRLSVASFLDTFKWCLLLYAILIAASYIIVIVLRVPHKDRYAYQMLTVYGNTGFIGLPICRALFGTQSLVFVTINNIIFGILIYTYGIETVRKAKHMQDLAAANGTVSAEAEEKISMVTRLKRFFNIGTIAEFLAIPIYLFDPQLPSFVTDIFTYIGEPTVFLSMVILGCAAASAPLKSFITGSPKMYLFLALRMLVLPICITVLLKQFIGDNALLIGTLMVLVSLPGANMPLILSKDMGLECQELSRGIILSTLICLVTIPVVALFL